MNRLIADHRRSVDQLCRHYRVHRLEAFGSAVEGGFDPASSDLDFLVRFEPCARAEHYERYFGLLEALEELFGRPIDLLEAGAMRNPYFIREVNRSRKLIYGAPLIISGAAVSASIMAAIRPGETPAPLLFEVPYGQQPE